MTVKVTSLIGRKQKPIWMTYKVSKLIKKKRCIYKKYKNNKHPAYIRIAKQVKAEVKNSKLQFEQKLADKKSFFAYVRSRSKTISQQLGSLHSTDGSVMENPTDIANEFNRYFASVFTKEDQSNLPEPKPLLSDHDIELQDLDITEYQVFQKLNSPRTGTDKAQGPDNG